MSNRLHHHDFAAPPSPDYTDEWGVLSSLVLHPAETIARLGGALDPNLFVCPACQTILIAATTLLEAGAPLGIVTLTQNLRESGELEKVGGPSEVTRLATEFDCTPQVAEHHLRRLRNKAALRSGQELSAWLNGACQNPAADPTQIVPGIMERAERIRALQDTGDAPARELGSLVAPALGDDSVLLGSRYLCRGGGGLLVGPTGIGKSSLILQASTSWSLNLPCFGIKPARPLRSVIIQAENDDGDMAEMRDGVFAGLGLSTAQRKAAGTMVHCFQENTRSGAGFFARTVEPLLRLHQPDLLWIDPALAYLGGESNSQKDVGTFLRTWLNPLLHRYECAAIIAHHTNKPPSGKEKAEWNGSDLAYLGSGSSEWANWARAVIAIRSLSTNGVFELCLGKRGGRVGWRNEAGEQIYTKLIGHAKEPGRIYWREAEQTEQPNGEKKTGRPKVFSPEKLLGILGDGSKLFSEWWADAEAHMWSKSTFKRCVAELEDGNRIVRSKLDHAYSRRITP